MKTSSFSIGTVFAFTVLCGSVATRADNFTTTVQQGTGNKWNDAIWQPGGVAPTPGNTYECIAGGNPTRVRNPASGSGDPALGVKTFPGDSLQLDANTEIRSKGPGNTLDFPGVGGNPGLIFNGGTIDTGDDGVFPLTGIMLVQADSRITCGDAAQAPRGWTIGAEIRGSAGLQITKQVADKSVPAVNVTSVNNPYSGTWRVLSGRLLGSGSGSLGNNCSIVVAATNAAIIPQVEVNYDILEFRFTHADQWRTNGSASGVYVQRCDYRRNSSHPWFAQLRRIKWSVSGKFPAGGSGSIAVQPPAPPSTPRMLPS